MCVRDGGRLNKGMGGETKCLLMRAKRAVVITACSLLGRIRHLRMISLYSRPFEKLPWP